MQCGSCGNELPRGAAHCPSCGAISPAKISHSGISPDEPTIVPSPHRTIRQSPAPPTPRPRRHRVKTSIIVAIVAIVVVLSGVAIAVLILRFPALPPTPTAAVTQTSVVTPSPGNTPTQSSQEPPYAEQQGSLGANTFADPYSLSAKQGRKISAGAWVQVSCKVYAPTISSASPDGYWYRIASSPWDNAYYAVANTFMNGDPWGGPYTHYTDSRVPDC